MKKNTLAVIAAVMALTFSAAVYADNSIVTAAPADKTAPAGSVAPAKNAAPTASDKTDASRARRPTRMELHEQVRQYREATRPVPETTDAAASANEKNAR